MLVHSVYFWLKPELSAQQLEQFSGGLNSLSQINSVEHCFVGRPSTTSRPVIDRSYSYALTVVFENLAAHDAYQIDPIHLKFVKECSTFWARVQIYDAE